MHVLIIGCGYVGLRAARAWAKAGHHVTALTRSTHRTEEWRTLGIQPVIGDVTEPSSLASLPSADLCLYAVGYDRSASADKRTVYVDGLCNVLKTVSSSIPRFIYISSTSVYGQDHGEVVNEDSLCKPISDGGHICLDAEGLLREYYPVSDSRQSAVVLRLAGIYGPGRLLARQDHLRAGHPLSGNPHAWLNLIHVADAVTAIHQLAATPTTSPCLLLSDGRPLQREEFYRTLAQHVGAPEPVFSPDHETGLNKRCDNHRIREELRLQLQYPCALDALSELVDLSRS